MSEVTEGDVVRVINLLHLNGVMLHADVVNQLAAALAEERRRVRDVFLAVGQDLQAAALMAPSRDEERAYRDADARIRRAAEEG